MTVAAVGTGLLFGTVADAEVHPLMLAFGDRDPRADVRFLLLGIEHLDVHELEQLHAVEPSLTVLHHAAPIQIAGAIGQLSLDDAGAHRRVPRNLDRTEMRQRSGLGAECDGGFFAALPVVLVRRHLRIRIAELAKFIDRLFMSRNHLLTVSRLSNFQRHGLAQGRLPVGRNDVEPLEVDRHDRDWTSFVDGQCQIDGIPLVVEFDVEGGDAGLGESAVGVERFDPLQVGIETAAVEEGLPPPRNSRADPRRQSAAQPRRIHRLNTCEVE